MMKKNLTWSKGLFSSLYKIYSNGKQLGNLIDKPFSRTIKGTYNGKEYLFHNSGFLNQITQNVSTSHLFRLPFVKKSICIAERNRTLLSVIDQSIKINPRVFGVQLSYYQDDIIYGMRLEIECQENKRGQPQD